MNGSVTARRIPPREPSGELAAARGAIAALRDTAHVEDVSPHTRARLGDAAELLADDIARVEALVASCGAGGVPPATGAADHLLRSGGKRVRPMALMLAASCFGAVTEGARELAAVAELIHAATLLHDDVIDDGDERRGSPTARRVWGNAVSVLAGDMLLVQALRIASRVGPRETWSELLATLGELVDGEVVQLRGRSALVADEDAYFAVVRGKTASLFRWALRAGARTTDAPEPAVDALGRFGEHLGVAFQLVDDVLDYAGDAERTGKTLLADALEGKVTLPLLLALARDESLAAELSGCRAGDAGAATRLAAGVRAAGTCDVVRARAVAETERAVRELDVLPPSAARDLLAAVARDLGARAC
mgnify:CR=1 FL=1